MQPRTCQNGRGFVQPVSGHGAAVHLAEEHMDVEAVFFDVGNTLIYPQPPVGEVYARALRQAGIEADADLAEKHFQETWVRLRGRRPPGVLEYGTTEAEAIEWWRRVVRESFRPFGEPEDFDALFKGLWEHFASGRAWRVFDDVLPTVAELERRGVQFGLISNWDVRLENVLRDLGLWGRFRWPVVSAHVGTEKPEAAIFRHALDLCGLSPGRVLHVGDSYEEDVRGARRAGLQAVWLRRGAADGGQGVIEGLGELLPMLG